MKNISPWIVAAFAVLTLLGEIFLPAFRAWFYERSLDGLAQSWFFLVPWALVAIGGGSAFLASRLKSLSDGTLEQRLTVLKDLPLWLAALNVIVFIAFPVVGECLMALGGWHPLTFDGVIVVLFVGLATGGMGWFQGIAVTDGLLVRFRETMGLREVHMGGGNLSFQARILFTTLGTGGLTGILMAVAGLGFYRTAAAQATLAGAVVPFPQLALELSALVLFLLVWSILLVAVVVSNFRRQFKRLSAKVLELSTGTADLTLRVPVVFFDELGVLTGQINRFLATLQPLVAEVQNDGGDVAKSALAVRDLAQEASMTTVVLAGSQGRVQQSVETQVLAIRDAQQLLSRLFAETGETKKEVESQLVLAAEASNAANAMVADVVTVGEMTRQADTVAQELLGTTQQGGLSLEHLMASMGDIENASRSVSAIVGMISKISAQTNLLAMNAAIEAAHAGAAGRGFAVVADEVRELAVTSAQSAKDIRKQIQAMDAKIQSGGLKARESQEAFQVIARKTDETSRLLETIDEAMDRQRSGSTKVQDSSSGLLAATQKIENLTSGQQGLSRQASDAIKSIIEATRGIEQAVTSQTLGTSRLTQAMSRVTAEATQNATAGARLGDRVKGFLV